MTDVRRRRVRRILLWTGVPFAIAGLVLGTKLIGLPLAAGSAIESYERGDFFDSVEQADPLLDNNYFQPWIAHFDRGTALAATGDYIAAITDLENAFTLATGEDRCRAAVNLSLAWELTGDSYIDQGQFAGAQRLYATARAVITEAGPECAPPEQPPPTREPGQELEDADIRLEEKEAAAEEYAEQSDNADETREQLEQLEQQNEDSTREKSEREREREDGADSGGGSPERPW